jgi:hypothetical protein
MKTRGNHRVERSRNPEMVKGIPRCRAPAVGASLNMGGASGGLLNMVTRSGVNIWHGDITFFAQNEALNARRPEVESSGTPRFRRYQPGVSANGPNPARPDLYLGSSRVRA